MKKNKTTCLILIAAGVIAAPSAMAHEIGSGRGDPFDSQPPGDTADGAAESDLLQELIEWFLPEEGEVEQDERSTSN
ncbi:MAG TPA: hypothetical protein VF275_05210 [Gammaproteobacteria bacterium]